MGAIMNQTLSSKFVEVFLIIFFILLTINFAKKLLINKAKINEIIMIPRLIKLRPKTPLSKTILI